MLFFTLKSRFVNINKTIRITNKEQNTNKKHTNRYIYSPQMLCCINEISRFGNRSMPVRTSKFCQESVIFPVCSHKKQPIQFRAT